MNSLSWKCLAVLALAFVVSGCGDPGPRLYKAGGTVTYKGAPVENAEVTFAYDDGNFANGVTDKDGKYQLNYMARPGGAALGKCKVGVAKYEGVKVTAPVTTSTGSAKSEADFKKQQKDKMDAMKKYADDKAKIDSEGGAKSLIPLKYKESATSGLAFEIKADEKLNVFPIELKD